MKPTDMHSGLTAERLREVLDYSPETGEFRWRKVRQHALVGRVAGCLGPQGYMHIQVDCRMYRAHRLAWLHFHGKWPVNEIDHINGICDDNRIVNLRDVSHQVNGQNQRKAQLQAEPSPFNTGMLGTYFYRERQRFVAKIRDPVTRKQKYLGSFSTAEDAHQAYLEAKRVLHEGNTL